MNRTQRREAQRQRRTRRRTASAPLGPPVDLGAFSRTVFGLTPAGDAHCHRCHGVMEPCGLMDFVEAMPDEDDRSSFLDFLGDDPDVAFWLCSCGAARGIVDTPLGPSVVNYGGGCSVPGCDR